MSGLFLVNILLAAAWGAVTGSFSVVNLAFGFVLGLGALYLIREQINTGGYFRRASRVTGLILLFLYELVMSAWRVARIVIRPKLDLNPGVHRVPPDG